MEEDTGKMKRREFLAALGAAATVGSALTEMGSPVNAQAQSPVATVASPDPPSATVPVDWAGQTEAPAAPGAIPTLSNPNILVIMVDQMRQPQWLDQNHLTTYTTSVIPNIWNIHNRAVSFSQYYVNATACTPSRACIMTGLYTPQTAMYLTQAKGTEPDLDSRYPTWGNAIQALNPAYSGNVWWFGKWHLSAILGGSLSAYGFNTSTYPNASNPSPNGFPNEGSNGGLFSCLPSGSQWYNKTFASDAQIELDFENWLNTNPAGPWCAAVSLINPHDVGDFPYWLTTFPGGCQQPNQPGYGTEAYFNRPGTPSNFYTAVPSPWNYESVAPGPPNYKPPLQQLLINGLDSRNNFGNPLVYPTDFITLLNYYYHLQSVVDQSVGRVLYALTQHPPLTSNTIVIFTADHGDYCGSHSMRAKGGAVYDESIRVPLYVAIPGMTQNVPLGQMCSAVDIFGLICDLAATSGNQGAWRTQYPDLANRESIYDYIYSNSPESHRTVTIHVAGTLTSAPYVLHTTDENLAGESADAPSFPELAGSSSVNEHVACIRTKTANGGNNGFKYAVYSSWDACGTIPNANPPDYEYYDYQDSFGNRAELGNNYNYNNNNNDPNSLQTLQDLVTALGAWGSPDGGTGIIGSELNATLTGKGTDGSSLRCVLLDGARPAYFMSLGQTGCTPPSCS
jgi:arylsulfatase A-like enzyme